MKWIAVMLCLAFSMNVAAQGVEKPLPTVKEVTKKLDELYRSDSSHSTVTMEVLNDRGLRTLELEQWTQGKDDALIVIRSPAREAGTATLKNKEGLWNYAPRADRMIRVPSGMLSDSWMGSHMTNDDLVRESDYDEDFKTSLSWVKEAGKTYLRATMTPLPKAPVVWEKIEYLLDADDWYPVRADYFDHGKMLRRMEFKDTREVDGRKIPFIMNLLPLDKPGERTTFKYSTLEFDKKVDGDQFSKQGLRRAAKSR
jgi:outer membrane lipoprotein-sorting protein